MKVKALKDSIWMGLVVAARGSVRGLAMFNRRELLTPAPYATQVATARRLRRLPLPEESAENHHAFESFPGSEPLSHTAAPCPNFSTYIRHEE